PATPPPAPLRRPAAPLSMHPTGPHRELPSFPTRRSSDLGADDAGPYLAVGVLGAHGGKQRDAHKVFVPVDVVVALFHKKRLPAQLDLWVFYRISVQNTMRGASLDKMHKSQPGTLEGQIWRKSFKTALGCGIIFVKYATKAERSPARRKRGKRPL